MSKVAHVLVFLDVIINEKDFQQHIIPQFQKLRINKNIARALLHCKRN